MYRVSLAQFEGPLDLLLFFVRRDELDIYDIPIAQIADEFLEYVRILEVLDLDRAGEFIYMAALLIEIKARMMLPRTEVDEEGEPIDPRTELVNRLLEYVRFKDAANRLDVLRDERAKRHERRPGAHINDRVTESEEDPLYEVSLFQMVSALKHLLDAAPEDVVHDVRRYHYTVESQRSYILETLEGKQPASFRDLASKRSKSFVIATFLAVLELVREGLAALMVRIDADDFFLHLKNENGD